MALISINFYNYQYCRALPDLKKYRGIPWSDQKNDQNKFTEIATWNEEISYHKEHAPEVTSRHPMVTYLSTNIS